MESEQDFFSDRSSNAWYPKSKYNPHEESTSKKHPSMPREITEKHLYDALVRLDTARYDDQTATSDEGEEEGTNFYRHIVLPLSHILWWNLRELNFNSYCFEIGVG